MIFSINIQGDELNILADDVAEINAGPGSDITREQYLTNIVMNHFTPRVRNIFIHEATTGDLADLKQRLGDVMALKARQRNRGNHGVS